MGQNITTGPPLYECMERVLTGDVIAEFWQQANLAGTHTASYFTTMMNKMTAHIFPTYSYRDQMQYIQRYLRKLPYMKVCTLTTRLLQLNAYLAYFPS